jgi:hypothetical protein
MPIKLAVSAGALCLLLGVIAPAYAQQRPNEEKRPEQQARPERPAHPPQAKPAPAPKPAPRAAQPSYGGAYSGGVKRTGPTHAGVHHSGVPQQQAQVRSGFVQSRAAAWSRDHHSWRERGGYNGYRIPEDRFRGYFGRDHFFRISALPLRFVGGYPRFLYDGYWVMFVDPWPETWAPNWYETDDCYIDYVDDGYYIFDRAHPGVAIAVTISL